MMKWTLKIPMLPPSKKKKKEIKVKIYVWPFISDPTEEGLETNQCN